jgi:probable HAF family extracellular repeat protein
MQNNARQRCHDVASVRRNTNAEWKTPVHKNNIALLAAAVVALPLTVHAQQYTVTEIGIPTGWEGVTGYGINDSGQVTGSLFGAGGLVLNAFVATPTPVLPDDALGGTSSVGFRTTDIGTLGGTSSEGYAINNSGQVTGYADTLGGEQHAFVTTTSATGNAMTDLGTLGGTQSVGRALNDKGQVTGWSYTTGNATNYAFVTDATTNAMTSLGGFGGASSTGAGINASGQVTGSHQDSGGNALYAFITGPNATGGTTLATLGGRSSSGNAINASGQVTGFSEICCGNSAPHAFITDATTNGVTDLGTLAGLANTQGEAINASGEVVGVGYDSGYNGHGILYANGKAVTVESLLPASLASEYTVYNATGINDSGQILADACLASGSCVALVLTPDVAPVPLPATAWLMLSGLGGLAALTRTKRTIRSIPPAF